MTSTSKIVDVAAGLGRCLPGADVYALVDALRKSHGLAKLLQGAGVSLREATKRLLALQLDESDRHLAAGVMLGVQCPDPTRSHVRPVWTGPSPTSTGRLTSATVVELIGQAVHQVLLVGYAVHNEPTVTKALHAARDRGVVITLVLERTLDNPGYQGGSTPFQGLDAIRLCWPSDVRPSGASLHAKILVVDETAALVGSANITGAALGKNIECGLLVRGGPIPWQLRQHIDGLRASGDLTLLP